ncbi:MAG: TIM barrel protein [bacterium]|nr:TIM barrel protein [bacterium]
MNNPIRLAVQEHLLPGDTLLSRLMYAQRVHLQGIELPFAGLANRMTTALSALEETRVEISAVNVGAVHLIHPDYDMREQAIITLREAMMLAVDLGADGVIFMPQGIETPRLPDLHPYKSTTELEAELLVTMLRTTLCDFADAFGVELYMMAGNRYITHLIHKLAHAERILNDNKNHPMLKIGANTFNMGMEENDIVESLSASMRHIGYVQMAYRRHPSEPNPPELDSVADSLSYALDTETVPLLDTLRNHHYGGWVTLAGSMKRDSDIVKYASLLQNYLNSPEDEDNTP